MSLDRYFTEIDAERTDELGFLDTLRSPRLHTWNHLLDHPISWVFGPPWIGKSTVASAISNHLMSDSARHAGLESRVALTRLGSPDADRQLPPTWWRAWLRLSAPAPAVWLIDGVDEALDRNHHLLGTVAETMMSAPAERLAQLRVLLFSRPVAELDEFRGRLQQLWSPISKRLRVPEFRLARLDRAAAAVLVGSDRFASVEDVIRRNQLQSVSGYPIVLNFLKFYRRDTKELSVAEVWRGILIALAGEPQTNRAARFASTSEERFRAACRVAAVLSLTRRDVVREWTPNPGEPTIGTLFQTPDNRAHTAAREACHTALFTQAGACAGFRFAQRNSQDWLTAFALEKLPLPALRSALIGPNGKLATRLREVARLLRVIRSDERTHSILDGLFGGVTLPSDAHEPTLTEVIRILDRLEELAAESPWGLRIGFDNPDDLARLRVDGLAGVLVQRLQDAGRPARVKRLLLDVAQATRCAEAVDVAANIVLDRTQEDELRYDAIWFVTRFGGDAHLAMLEVPIGEGTQVTEIECRVRGVLIRELLTRGIWPRWRVALNSPRVNSSAIDNRFVLWRLVAEGMTLEDARHLLPHLRVLFHQHAEPNRPHEMPEHITRAIELVLAQTPPDPCDLASLVRFATEVVVDDQGYIPAREVALQLQPFAWARRQLFRHDVEHPDLQRLNAWSLLQPEDWAWLRDQALGEWAGNREIWGRAYWLARRTRESGHLSESDWQSFVKTVEENAPGLPAEWEEGLRRYESELARQAAEDLERRQRDPSLRPLADQVRQLLDDSGLSAPELMRELSWMCFTDYSAGNGRLGNRWNDLASDLRRRVLDACFRGLEAGGPTQIPHSGSFSGTILAEGAAFEQVLESAESRSPLTDQMIRRWLPTALFCRMSGDWSSLLHACCTDSPEATEAGLIEAIRFNVRRVGPSIVIGTIPDQCWTGPVFDCLVELISDESVRPTARRELLEVLAKRDPERAAPIAVAWAARRVTSDEADTLRAGGRNVVLSQDPARALDLIEAEFPTRRMATLIELPLLSSGGGTLVAQGGPWPLHVLERMVRLLLQAYPIAADPKSDEDEVTPEDDLRSFRDWLVADLLRRDDPNASAVLDRITELDPDVAARVSARRANQLASQCLPDFDPSSVRDAAAISVTDAARLLDRGEFRLIRSTDDLLDAVLTALQVIDATIGHDLSLLYSTPDEAGVRRHLREDALQAYLRLRLLDELSRLADGIDVQIVREDQVARRQRLDLRVTAPRHSTNRLATVVIEVKWSTNDEVRTALEDQLGTRYLLGEGFTHGVYAVGWSGVWRPGDGSGENTDPESLQDYLTNQRDCFCERNQLGATLRIEPFLLRAQWDRS